MEFAQHHIENIAMAVIDAAHDIFVEAGAEDDFCIQETSGAWMVFGSTNRILYHPAHGFEADLSACTTRFLVACMNDVSYDLHIDLHRLHAAGHRINE